LRQREDKIPLYARDLRLRDALQSLVKLYEGQDKKDEAAKWRQELGALKASKRVEQPKQKSTD
jgi:hypothetical protein